MAGRARTSRGGEERRRQWLGSPAPARGRGWALEEELFGPPARERLQRRLEAELAVEREELARLNEQLRVQRQRVRRAEQQLAALTGAASHLPSPLPERPTLQALEGEWRRLSERALALRRCEGFQVDSPEGTIGYVEGVRYTSGIEEPGQLEVRAGWLGRRLLLIPVDEVEQVLLDEGRVLVRGAHGSPHHLWQAVRGRLRAHAEQPTRPA
ncbi:MAG TPA: hypothetical protein VNJ46_09465 [Gaiellaceae bacterium]|nr:hypothetical protein [Gaiellaceae bacterium]